MAQNPGQDAQIPLTLFAGMVSNIDPVALPAGASPDCSDMQFLPAGTSSRACLQKVLATPLGVVTVTYGKSYVDPAGTIRNLFLDSLGNFWVQNITAGTVPSVIATTTPGSYCRSITAFGREYIAISDGAHGTEVPLQLSFDSAGNAQLDRVTSDGPGTSPTVSNLILPPVDVSASATPLSLTIVEIDPENADPDSGFFTSINVYTSSALTGVQIGQTVLIAGTGTPFDGTWGPITAVYAGSPNSLIQITAFIPAGTPFWVGSETMTINQGALQRQSNVVTGETDDPHQLQPGYQVQITNAAAQEIGTGISAIVIDNENEPGIATIEVALASGANTHGLVPGLNVSISGVKPVAVGGGISSIVRSAQKVTVVMAAATGLNPSATVTIAGVTPDSFNGIWQVLNVSTTTNPFDTFTYAQVDVDAAGSGGTTAVNWPVPDTSTPSFFEVIAAPSPTSFQIAINYCDGSWTTGKVFYPWNGTFFVQTVPDANTFTYQQYGPDGSASPVSGSIIATPFGQATPGEKQMQVFFIDRQGGITSPSPPVKFIANGGQYLAVANIPLGPPTTTVARGVAFTGSQGAYFFYIPSPPQVNGQLVGTATQINDNTTTSAIFDFGDPTLFAALGISTQGNNLANQIVLDGALGFGYYGSRLITWGQRNIIDNLLNMGFDGGYVAPVAPATAQLPTGWTIGDTAGQLEAGHYGQAWQIATTAGAGAKGSLSQSIYEDYTGAPIATANTKYRIRVWLKPSAATANLTFTVSMTSASTPAANITATIAGNLMNAASGSFLEANFSANTPAVIPSDYTLKVYASSVTTSPTLLVDELKIIYAQTPYLNGLFGSYVNNPEGFDGVSGPFGPVNDTHPVLDIGIIRDNLYLLTQDPGGRLHETSQGLTEPADWVVNEVAANCGTVSAFALARSQADDSSAAGGEEWFSWMSSTGYRIFGGEEPDKLSQEIQRPAGLAFPGAPPDLNAINPSAFRAVWSLNDPANKVIYLGIPTGNATAPTVIWQLSYLGLDSASSIIGNPPIHKALSGKLVATDMGRKWSPWKLAMNGAALMLQGAGDLQVVFFAGSGVAPNQGAGVGQFGNVYTLNANLLTDDDYGLVQPYYDTYAFPDRDTEQQLQLGSGMKMVTYAQFLLAGVGYAQLAVFINTLATRIEDAVQVSPLSCDPTDYLLSTSPNNNLEWAAEQATGQRFFWRIASTPNPAGTTASPATDNGFSLSVLGIGMKQNARFKVRGLYP